jgi:hypothetical protein
MRALWFQNTIDSGNPLIYPEKKFFQNDRIVIFIKIVLRFFTIKERGMFAFYKLYPHFIL